MTAPDASIVTTTAEGGRTLAWTFDDGPDPEHTPALLEVLREHGITATFFLWGDHVRQHPEVARQIAREGHVLGNHSMHHDDLGGWSAERVRADLAATSDLIREVVPGARVPWFRAPFGSWGATPQVAAELGMQPLGWSVVVEDWEEPGADVLVERVLDRLVPAAVVLLHDGGGDRSGTVEAVARLAPRLLADGWAFGRPAASA